jgi:hypothetical protein
MSQPIHTPGPAQLPTGFKSVQPDGHDGMPLFVTGDPFDTVAIVLPRKECNANARLLAAAYNAFDSAARKLGCNAVELAEQMQDGAIAELVSAVEKAVHNAAIMAGKPGKAWEGDFVIREMIAALAKVKGGAS